MQVVGYLSADEGVVEHALHPGLGVGRQLAENTVIDNLLFKLLVNIVELLQRESAQGGRVGARNENQG